MKITKFGQCCLLIEIAGRRILTDPGRFSVGQNEVKNIDLILITHEHADHFHSESITEILKLNPNTLIVTNTSVGQLLAEMGVTYEVLEGVASGDKAGVTIEAYDGKHAEIFEEVGQVQNTGYFIAGELFYPGDSYIEPEKPVRILALPVSGPWCKMSDAIRYALKVKPIKAFPVHDAILNPEGIVLTHGMFKAQLQTQGIEFIPLTAGETKEL